MPPPIVPAPMTPTRRDRRGSVSSGRSVDLGGLALGEEDVALRGRLGAAHQLHEQLALEGHALGEGQVARRPRPPRMQLRGASKPRNLLRVRLAEGRRTVPGLPRASAILSSRSRTRGEACPSAGPRSAKAIASRDQPRPRRRARRPGPCACAASAPIGLPGGDHLQRLLDADDARQALRAAGARQQAELHLGQAELRRRHGDAVMAAERHLEPAAERRAVDRRDHRLGRMSRSMSTSSRRPRLARRLAELGDVGAAGEQLARAGQHDRADRRIRARFRDRSRRLSRRAAPSAFTGGEARVMTATRPSRRRVVGVSVMLVSSSPCRASGPVGRCRGARPWPSFRFRGAVARAQPATMPRARRSAIWSASRPSSARSAPVCSPRLGGGRRTGGRSAVEAIGRREDGRRGPRGASPPAPCVRSGRPRAGRRPRRRGCPPPGAPRSASPAGCVRARGRSRGASRSRWRERPRLVAKSGSAARSSPADHRAEAAILAVVARP